MVSHESQQNNVWFGISMGLIGIIIGFVFATFTGSAGFSGDTGTQARVPSAPNAPSAPVAPAAEPAQPKSAGEVVPVDFERDHIRGNKDATLAIIEYSDFECPYCARVHPTMKSLIEKNGDNLMWVYRHFPLGFHKKAVPAAIASECAYELGGDDAFWAFADEVYENSNFDYAGIAKTLKLNESKFADCIESDKYAEFVQNQMKGGSDAGVTGTPGNIIYNLETKESRLAPGARPEAMLQADIDAMLGKN